MAHQWGSAVMKEPGISGAPVVMSGDMGVSIGPFPCQPHLDSGGGHRDGWPTGCRHRWRCRPQTVQHFSG